MNPERKNNFDQSHQATKPPPTKIILNPARTKILNATVAVKIILKLSYRNNTPRSIYQYSNMAPRLSGQTSIFDVVFFVCKSPLGIEGQKKLEKFAILIRKPRSHAWILIYRTWPILKPSTTQPWTMKSATKAILKPYLACDSVARSCMAALVSNFH